MDLRTYIERDGERISRSHPELLRLATAMEMSPYTLYVVALGHKKLSLRKAVRLAECTGGDVAGASVCDDYPTSISVQSDPLRKAG